QIVGFVALALTRGARLAQRRPGITEPQIGRRQLCSYLRILRRLLSRAAQLDQRRFEIALFEVSLGSLEIAAPVTGACRGVQVRRNRGGAERAPPPRTRSG